MIDWGELRVRLGDVVQAPFDVSQLPGVQYTTPLGDPGLFGPGSVTWKVGSDWPSALVGGMSGLILGTLHPLVLAGTLDHSIFRTDPIGRLARTASFVMGTAFAATPVAMGAIDYVNRLHQRISGTAPNGNSYRATDGDLAVWTHVTIYGGFLDGHLRYSPNPISEAEQDAWWDEVARVPEMLGAINAPRSRQEVQDYYTRVMPDLEASQDALESARWVLDGGKGESPTVRGAAQALVDGWEELMPALGKSRTLERKILKPSSTAGGTTCLRSICANCHRSPPSVGTGDASVGVFPGCRTTHPGVLCNAAGSCAHYPQGSPAGDGAFGGHTPLLSSTSSTKFPLGSLMNR